MMRTTRTAYYDDSLLGSKTKSLLTRPHKEERRSYNVEVYNTIWEVAADTSSSSSSSGFTDRSHRSRFKPQAQGLLLLGEEILRQAFGTPGHLPLVAFLFELPCSGRPTKEQLEALFQAWICPKMNNVQLYEEYPARPRYGKALHSRKEL